MILSPVWRKYTDGSCRMEAVGRKNNVDKNHLIASGMESTSCGKQAEHFNIVVRVWYVTVKGGCCCIIRE